MKSNSLNSAQASTRAEAKENGLPRYFTGVACKHGHIDERHVTSGHCLQCDRDRAAEKRAKDPEGNRAAMRLAYAENRAKYQLWEKNHRASDPDAFKKRRRAHYQKNAQQISADRKARRISDPVFSFNDRARAMIRGSFSRLGLKKNSNTEAILGCSLTEFREHIERQFMSGMGWGNMNMWDIDHIIPASSARSLEDAKSLNSYSNLRPLWRNENRSKSNKFTHLI